ncbi:MAG: twin-arginine translocation signal domain-containing protein, partial [Betaproteobacteria bacterium]|nr:twin-arginine translocation signal domain-containing protein [Betaproteobacteria bacterium]
MNAITVSRRDFLKSSGALVVQVGLGAGLAADALDAAAQAAPPRVVGPHPSSLDTWIRIAADGIVTVNSGKMDCGQGLDVAYAQIVADELDVPFESVQV